MSATRPCLLVDTIPAEVVVSIFRQCDSLHEVWALMLTCTRLHHVWLTNAPSIVDILGPQVIPAFDLALMAVRATTLVHDNLDDGLLPPEIDLSDLAARAGRMPDATEFQEMLDLHHLVSCVEVRYCHVTLPEHYVWEQNNCERWPEDRIPPPPTGTPEEPGEGMRVWRERFHGAAYITLIMGAVFCRAYQQPFFPSTAPSSPDGNEMEDSRRELLELMRKAVNSQSWCNPLEIKERERDYLRRFPIFDLTDELGEHSNIFRPFIEWFMGLALDQLQNGPPRSSRDLLRDDVKAVTQFENPAENVTMPGTSSDWPESGLFTQWFTGGTDAQGEAILWLTMQSIHMFEFIHTCIVNGDGTRGQGRCAVRKPHELAFSGKVRTARVVLFGVFAAEEIEMPGDYSDSADHQLLADPAIPHKLKEPFRQEEYLSASPPILDLPLMLQGLYQRSGIANRNHGEKMPPPPLQLFTFILKHHFYLQFNQRMFYTFIKDVSKYHWFRNRATIFSNGPENAPNRQWFDCTNGSEWLIEYKPPLLTWQAPFSWEELNPRTWDLEEGWSHY
ncbi:hypothetical protein F5X68DRAFT_238200 [Plectosphaerella plurivora]|uniref:F-box domain-containing protein n=1 Tax=Plectosphaerella plurivora TaxID=936078 RepID=A0A9P9ACY9_9PEZI|nr:hypothetical protein F5X68DRAFT_238200 [Plectosphaerella plurivora]